MGCMFNTGETDNAPLIESILSLKLEKAKLLGYSHHADVSMASKVGWHLFHEHFCVGIMQPYVSLA